MAPLVCVTDEVTDAQLRDCAKAALDLYSAASDQLRVPQDGTIKFQATFPIAMYALNQVNGALVLAERDREYLAVANVRVAYEHAVTPQWVLCTEGAEDKLGLLVRERRHDLRLGQAELAARAGVGRPWLVAVEQGHARAELGKLLALLAELGRLLDLSPNTEANAASDEHPEVVDLDRLLGDLDERARDNR